YIRVVPTAKLRSLELSPLTVNLLSPTWTTRNVALGSIIAQCPGLAALRRLELRHAGVGEEGAHALIDSPYLKNLEYLNLEDNGIDANTEKALRKRFGAAVILGRSDFSRFTIVGLS